MRSEVKLVEEERTVGLTSATCWKREVARLRSDVVASGGSLSG